MSGPAAAANVLCSEPDAVRKLVSRVVVKHCRHAFGDCLRSVVLTGSLARDEASVLREDSLSRLLGDADFILLFHSHASLPAARVIAPLISACETELRASGLAGPIGVAAVHDHYFRRLPRHIFSYELRERGLVVWGDANVFSLIPAFSAEEIEPEDAWHTLSNRIIEWLELASELSSPPMPREDLKQGGGGAAASWALHYRTIKLYLDMATSLLVFCHAYRPTYRERAEALHRLANHECKDANPPFPLSEFALRVSSCTRWKIHPDTAGVENAQEYWEEAVAYALALWRWELKALAAAPPQLTTDEMFRRVARQQPMLHRLRGWSYVLRRQGWLRSWRDWPRWLDLSCRGTPRYLVYRAAFELATHVLGRRKAEANPNRAPLEAVQALLPVANADKGSSDCNRLIASLVWNYKRFLVETRA